MNIIQLVYMNENLDNKELENIRNMYKNLNYFDQYGLSVIVFVLITFVTVVLYAYFYAKANIQPIINDWPNQRCKPYYIPLAGIINKPKNMTASEYTVQNFNYCTQNILTSITGTMLEPITYITNTISSVSTDFTNDINSGRQMFNKVRTYFQTIIEEIMGRIMNIMVPLQQIIISFKDILGKVQGIMTTSLFTFLGTYYTLQSLMGAISQVIVGVLIGMAALIVIFWLIPFTWSMAFSLTTLFISLSIPLALMLVFFVDVLQIQPNVSIPALAPPPALKCFDKNTLILMKDGTNKKIIDICIGDYLYHDGLVTAKIKVETKGSIMYKLYDVIVSDTHLVYYKNEWIRVDDHPDAIKIDYYDEPYLYCLNTSSKTIYINYILFSDWDEIVGDNFTYILDKKMTSSEIHEILDTGFYGTTQVKLLNTSTKDIKDVEIGDILENGEKVYGVVEIHGETIKTHCQYILGKKTFIKCSENIIFYDESGKMTTSLTLDEGKQKRKEKNIELKLYHLITDKKKFKINEITFCDYSSSFDFFLKK